ncbi:hypothetical protein FHS18_005517 [Paenibacillus phyllosphaerae]|uniref:Uncharacterized protein n=1 Tax=Paenibacillus phyllosphaerae TaxID=274593 RepID=A0A7W5B2U4_9BACL|nr:hypothetical protein [Paenibacillus phyllosphaerae]MBB3113405.1 hypothetical protein [Paenibacillus phyllosphaerae]
MPINIDIELIEDFRDVVNDNPFFRYKYKNIDGKNKLNAICSAMDWITVTADGLCNIEPSPKIGIGYDHLETLNLMQYIISIDVLVDAIIQLHRALITPYPLKNDKSIFSQSKLNDDTYFKHIRAVFGTHPVNLDSIDGVKPNTEERFFASWPAKAPGHGDFMVYVYSNNPDKSEKLNPISINIEQLNRYAELRYQLLIPLKGFIDSFMDNHTETKKTEPIPKTYSDPIDFADNLIKESIDRFGPKYGHHHKLAFIRRLLSIGISPSADSNTTKLVANYKSSLIKNLNNIHDDLQKMDIQHNWDYSACGYEFEKIGSYFAAGNPIGMMLFEELANTGPLPRYLIDSNKDEQQLILESYLHHACIENAATPVNFKFFQSIKITVE